MQIDIDIVFACKIAELIFSEFDFSMPDQTASPEYASQGSKPDPGNPRASHSKNGFISVNGFEEKEEGHCQKGRGAASWPGECQL